MTPSIEAGTSTSAELKAEVKAPKMEGKRAKLKCPVPNFPREYVVHLPRHLRDFHKWSKEKAAQAISQFNLRKPRKRKIAERSREHKCRVCPVRGCNAVVKRIHNHLRGKHKLTPDDTRYHDYLKETLFHELPETFQEDIISVSSGSNPEESMEEKSKTTKEDSVLGEDIREENWDETDRRTDDETANVSSLKLLWAQTFGSQGEASDESSDDGLTPQGANNSVRKQRDAPLWNASQTPLSEKEESSIKPTKNSPDLSPFVHKDSDPEYIPETESTSGEEDSSPSTSKQIGDTLTSFNSDSHENIDFQVGDAHSLLFDDDIHGASDELLEETSSNKRTEETLDQFFKWLTGIDGGRREEKTATKQYVSQARNIVKKVDPEYHRVSSLVSTRLVRDNWLDPLEKSRRPGTCKSYLGSLSKFFRFVMVEKPSGLKVKFDAVRAAKEQVHEWMSSYNKPIARRMWE